MADLPGDKEMKLIENYINDMQWMASCFCSNSQLVKRLHHLRHLQLLVQVLKAPAIFAGCKFLWLFFVQDWESGWAQRRTCDRNLQWTKSTNVTGHLSIACQVNSDLIRLRCARLKIATTFRVSRCFPSDESLCANPWWRSASIQCPVTCSFNFGFYEILWCFAGSMPHNPLILNSFFIVFPKHGVWEVPQISSQLPKSSHGRSRGGRGLFPSVPGICARQSLLGFVWRWRICEWKCLGNIRVCVIFEQDD